MGIKSLAEAVILQSLEDFWSPIHKEQSEDFFKGEGFKVCANIAGLDALKQIEILCYLGGEKHGKPARVYRA